MAKDHEKEQIIRVKNEIVAGEHPYIDSFYNKTCWNIFDAADLLAACHLTDVHDLNEFMSRFQHVHHKYFSVLDKGIINGKMTVIESVEMRKLPSKPEFMPNLGLKLYLKQHTWYRDKIFYRVSPNNKLLARYVSQEEVLRYAKEVGLTFPESSAFPRKNGPDSEKQNVGENLSKEQTDPPKRKRGKVGAEARWAPRDIIVSKAAEFMKLLVNECDCHCRHDVLANITYELGNNGSSYKELDEKGFNLLAQFKTAALSIVPEERQFGNDRDPKCQNKPNPNKLKLYDAQACKCPIKEHQNYTLPRYRE